MSEQTLVSSPPPRVGRLDSLKRVRLEMARVYADCRTGKLPTQDGSRLVFMLANIAKIIEQADLESRVEALEQQLKGTAP